MQDFTLQVGGRRRARGMGWQRWS